MHTAHCSGIGRVGVHLETVCFQFVSSGEKWREQMISSFILAPDLTVSLFIAKSTWLSDSAT